MNYIYHIPCECGEFARKRKNGEPIQKKNITNTLKLK